MALRRFNAGGKKQKDWRLSGSSEAKFPEKTKGQQLKVKIVSALFHTFSRFSTVFTLFRIFSSDFSYN